VASVQVTNALFENAAVKGDNVAIIFLPKKPRRLGGENWSKQE
jgi:hypothetical protein